jgi:hypothetical protein
MKSPRPSLPMTGGCQCGAIRYEITSFPLLLYTCNCTDCQRQTGSAFALNMPVRFADFRVLQGEPNGWHHTSPNGTPVISRFCGNCGTRLYGERAGRPETISLRAGTLDDTSWLVPVAHFFTRSAQPWVQPAPGAQCFETQPNGWGSLLPGWRARWSDPADSTLRRFASPSSTQYQLYAPKEKFRRIGTA